MANVHDRWKLTPVINASGRIVRRCSDLFRPQVSIRDDLRHRGGNPTMIRAAYLQGYALPFDAPQIFLGEVQS